MVTILFIVTLVSLVMTIVLSVVVVRLTRDERRRSDARAAALAQMADAVEPDADDVPAEPIAPRMPWRALAAVPPPQPVAPQRQPARFEDVGLDNLTFDDPVIDHVAPSGDLFVVRTAQSPWPRRVGIVAAVVTVAIVTGIGLSLLALRGSSPNGTPAHTPAASATAATGLLELMSLKHTQAPDALTITGLVQNPRDGVPLSKIVATAFLFSADGTFLASGRAPLDFTTLRPGDESGFVITVPVTAPVGRYRVGFRADDGRVIGHVDRRTSSTIASDASGARGGSS